MPDTPNRPPTSEQMRAWIESVKDPSQILRPKKRGELRKFSEVPTIKLEGDIAQQIEKAVEIMGVKNVMGPKEVEKTFGSLDLKDIPDIDCSKEDFERAKELNQMLILRVNKGPDGKPLTIVKMNELLKGGFEKKRAGKILADEAGWKAEEDFYKTETPVYQWAFVSKELIPESTSKNYLDQTEEIAKYLKGQEFKGRALPKKYKDAIDTFNKEKGKIKKLMSDDWPAAAKQLSELEINELCRQTPAEAMFDMLVYFQNTGERLLEKTNTWSNRRDADGYLVGLGGFGAGGVGFNGWDPDFSRGVLGVSFSRSLAPPHMAGFSFFNDFIHPPSIFPIS